MIDSRTRCCCGGCPIRGGTMAAAIFIIVTSAIILLWSIVSISRQDRVSTNGGTLVFMGLLILAASLVLWGLKAREYWPCIFIIVLLSLGLIGWCYRAAISGIAIGVLGDCNDRETWRSITFNDPDGSFRHLSSSDNNTDCNIAKGVLLAVLIVSLICLALYVWFIYIFSKAIGYIKYMRINAPPVFVGTINTGYEHKYPAFFLLLWIQISCVLLTGTGFVLSGTIAAATFLIFTSTAVVCLSIYGVAKGADLLAAPLVGSGFLVLAATLFLWRLDKVEIWPWDFMIAMLAINSIGCMFWAIVFGFSAEELGDCQTTDSEEDASCEAAMAWQLHSWWSALSGWRYTFGSSTCLPRASDI